MVKGYKAKLNSVFKEGFDLSMNQVLQDISKLATAKSRRQSAQCPLVVDVVLRFLLSTPFKHGQVFV